MKMKSPFATCRDVPPSTPNSSLLCSDRRLFQREEPSEIQAFRRSQRLQDVPLVCAGHVPRRRVYAAEGPLDAVGDQREYWMQRIAAIGLDHDAKLVAARADQRSEGKERDGVDEGLDETGVELVAGQPRENQAGVLGQRRVLIGPRAGDRLVNVCDRDDLAHGMRDGIPEIGIASALEAAMMLDRCARSE